MIKYFIKLIKWDILDKDILEKNLCTRKNIITKIPFIYS